MNFSPDPEFITVFRKVPEPHLNTVMNSGYGERFMNLT
jgi:hypothetical protein